MVGIASDLLNAKFTTVYISQSNTQADFHSTDDVFIQLNLKKDADWEADGKQIKELAAAYPQFNVVSGRNYYNSLRAVADAAFSAVYILFAILAAVVIGLLFGIIAAIIPARQVARLEIVQALRYE